MMRWKTQYDSHQSKIWNFKLTFKTWYFVISWHRDSFIPSRVKSFKTWKKVFVFLNIFLWLLMTCSLGTHEFHHYYHNSLTLPSKTNIYLYIFFSYFEMQKLKEIFILNILLMFCRWNRKSIMDYLWIFNFIQRNMKIKLMS